MAFPVTLNGRTYTLTDFEGTNYVDGLPDAFEDFVTHAGDIYNSTSTTSNSIGTGSKTFTVEANKPYQAGTPLRIADAAAPSTNFLDTVVTSYSGTTLVVNSIGYGGSGTKTSWTVNIGGAKTVDGTLGVSQGGTGATTAAGARTNIDVYSKSETDTRYLNISGDSADISFGANMSFGDNNKIIMGSGSDLEIYHSGAHSYIDDAGGGVLILQTNGSNISINSTGKNMGVFTKDAEVTLYYNNSPKIATSTTGIDVTGVVTTLAGSASAPAYSFGTDTNNGMFKRGTDQLGFSAGGTEIIAVTSTGMFVDTLGSKTTNGNLSLKGAGTGGVVVNDDGADRDFRVESDGAAHMLFVDANENKVGINQSSPSALLDINGTTADSDGILRVYQNVATSNPTVKILQRGEGGSSGTNQGLLIDIAGHNQGNGYILNTSVTNSNINGGVAISPFSVKGIGTFEFRQGGVINENGADSDFRVESDNQSFAFFVDAGNSATTLTNAGGFKARFESNGDGQRIVTSNAGHTIGMVSGASYALNTNNTFIKLTGGGGVVRITANNLGVNLNNNATSFSSASDIRLKNITGTFTNAIEDVKTLEPVKFTWKHDAENTPNVGFTAQSVQPVLPEAVDSNDVFDDGNEYLSVRYTEVIPLITAALQEAITKIETLEARITALESN